MIDNSTQSLPTRPEEVRTFEALADHIASNNRSQGRLVNVPSASDVWDSVRTNPNVREANQVIYAIRLAMGDTQPPKGMMYGLMHGIEYLGDYTAELLAMYDVSNLDVPCPVTLLIEGWMQANPPKTVAPIEKQGMLIPSTLAYHDKDRRFSMRPAVHQQQLELPGFHERHRKHGGMLPIELFLLDNLQVRSGGPSAPLSQRLFIAALAMAPLNIPPLGALFQRSARTVFDILYPLGKRRFHRWLWQLEAAANELYVNGWVPYSDRITGRSQRLQPVITTAIPTESIIDPVAFLVRIPAETKSGPMMHPRLMEYGQNHGRAFNALLQLAYHWHAPGVTVTKSKASGRWTHAYHWDRYEPYSRNEIIELTAPTSTAATRNRYMDAMKTLRWLESQKELELLAVGQREFKIRPYQPEHLRALDKS